MKLPTFVLIRLAFNSRKSLSKQVGIVVIEGRLKLSEALFHALYIHNNLFKGSLKEYYLKSVSLNACSVRFLSAAFTTNDML